MLNNMNGTDHSEDTGEDGRITLEMILDILGGRVWN
jgi:hypothetical protein